MATETEFLVVAPPGLSITLSDLKIAGTGGGSALIIKPAETFKASVKVEFGPNPDPFVHFLLFLKLKVEVQFAIESIGPGAEVLTPIASETTTAPGPSAPPDATYVYTPTFSGTANGLGLDPGPKKVIAIVTLKDPSGVFPLATGFLGEGIFQVSP